MSLNLSFAIPNFGNYWLSFDEENFQDLRTNSTTSLQGWEVYLVPGSLRVANEKFTIVASPGRLGLQGCQLLDDAIPPLSNEFLDPLTNFFDAVWRRLYKGFSPCEGFCLEGIPLPIAEEIHEHLSQRFTTPLGMEFTLRRMPPGKASVYWDNSDLEISKDDGVFVACTVSKKDFIHENRRGLYFSLLKTRG